MAPPALGVIDARAFPLVHIQGPNLVPGDGPRIIEDLETLIQHAQEFVLVIVNGDDPPQRQHDEDKARMLWLKQNKALLAKVCKGIVSVMPNRQRLLLIEKQATGLQAALGIRFLVTENLNEANAEALRLLEDVRLGLSS